MPPLAAGAHEVEEPVQQVPDVRRARSPAGLAGGISGSSNRNWSSVRTWPEPKSPTSARSAGVHMAVSRQETARNAAREARISPSNRCPQPFANGVLAWLCTCRDARGPS